MAMTDLVACRYPVPLRYVPRRGRAEACGYEQGILSVRLREISSSEAPVGPTLPLSGSHGVMPTRILDGVMWRPILTGPMARGADGGARTLTGASFRRWLSSEADAGLDDATGAYLGRHLAGTPLLARLPHLKGQVRHDGIRHRARVGRMVEDGAERAAVSIATFIGEEVALVGGVAHMRCRGPLAVTTDHGSRYQVLSHPGAFEHFLGYRDADLCRLDRIGMHRDAHRGRRGVHDAGGAPPRPRWDPGEVEGLLHGDDDVRLFVNEAPRWLLSLAGQREPSLTFAEGCMTPGDGERLRSHFMWGAVGGVGHVGDLAGPCRDVVAAALAATLRTSAGEGLVSRIHAYGTRFALPLVDAPALVDEVDRDALAGLGA